MASVSATPMRLSPMNGQSSLGLMQGILKTNGRSKQPSVHMLASCAAHPGGFFGEVPIDRIEPLVFGFATLFSAPRGEHVVLRGPF